MRLRPVRLAVACGVCVLALAASSSAALDRSRTVTATIGSAGGTLSVTAADGSESVLSIPRGALAGDERVTMTPLRARLPAGLEQLAAVDLQPAGLRLLMPASLEVDPAFPGPAAQRAAFGYRDGQFGLVPLSARGSLRIPLLALGDYGLVRASAAQLTAAGRNPPADPEAAWLSRLAAQQLNGAGAAIRTQIGSYFGQAIKPLLAPTGFAAWEHAASRAIGWEREAQLLGYRTAFGAGRRQVAASLLGRAPRPLIRRIRRSCATGAGTLRGLQQTLVISRVLALLGRPQTGAGDVLAACARRLAFGAGLGPTRSDWESASSGDRVSSIVALVSSDHVPLAFVQQLGDDRFAFVSSAVAVGEQMQSYELGNAYAASGCSALTFGSAAGTIAFAATLTVPADLFDGVAPPPVRVEVAIGGSDDAAWTMTCQPGQTVAFQQSPGAMAGLSAVTAITPISLTTKRSRASFSTSGNIVNGGSIVAFVGEHGSVTITLPR